jgi:hypothetical protein
MKKERKQYTAEAKVAILRRHLVKGEVVHRVTPVDVPRAVLYKADLNKIYVSDGGGALRVSMPRTFIS